MIPRAGDESSHSETAGIVGVESRECAHPVQPLDDLWSSFLPGGVPERRAHAWAPTVAVRGLS